MKQIYTALLLGAALGSQAQLSSGNIWSLGLNWPVGETFTSFDLGLDNGTTVIFYENDLTRGPNNYVMSLAFSSAFSATDDYQDAATYSGNEWVNVHDYSGDAGATWEHLTRETLWNDGSKDTAFMQESWDPGTGSYNNDMKVRFNYSGNNLTGYESFWNNAGVWTTAGEQTFYWSGGQIVRDSSWSGGMTTDYSIYHYSGSQLDSVVEFEWDFTLNDFVRDEKVEFVYNGSTVTKVHQHGWDISLNQWEYNITFFLGGSSIGLAEEAKVPSLYPNPAMNYINLPEGTESVRLFSVRGEDLGAVKVENNRLNTSGLRTGVYFVHFQNGAVAKFVKY